MDVQLEGGINRQVTSHWRMVLLILEIPRTVTDITVNEYLLPGILCQFMSPASRLLSIVEGNWLDIT